MNKNQAVVVALALLLNACTVAMLSRDAGRVDEEGFDAAKVTRPDPHRPNIFIDETTSVHQVFIDQEPISVHDVGDRVVISWALPILPARYVFAGDGIVIRAAPDGPAPVGLRCDGRRKVFICSYDRPRPGTRYKYSVKVLEDKNALPTLDPFIANN